MVELLNMAGVWWYRCGWPSNLVYSTDGIAAAAGLPTSYIQQFGSIATANRSNVSLGRLSLSLLSGVFFIALSLLHLSLSWVGALPSDG
jgi:hypothetical protein